MVDRMWLIIELSSTPPSSWGVEYAGWDAQCQPHQCRGHSPPLRRREEDLFFENDAPYHRMSLAAPKCGGLMHGNWG